MDWDSSPASIRALPLFARPGILEENIAAIENASGWRRCVD